MWKQVVQISSSNQRKNTTNSEMCEKLHHSELMLTLICLSVKDVNVPSTGFVFVFGLYIPCLCVVKAP